MSKSSDGIKQSTPISGPAQNPSAPTTYSLDKSQRAPRGFDAIRSQPTLQIQQQLDQQNAREQKPQLPKQPETHERQPQPQQQQQGIPSADEIKGKWKQHAGAAKIVWGKLTEDELLKLEGHEQKLAGLVQERYAITRDEAEKQVRAFYERHKI